MKIYDPILRVLLLLQKSFRRQWEFRTGLSRAQCSIAYNGNMGVCNQWYRWRLTVPGLLCNSRVFIELAYREISVQQTPGN